MLEILLSDVGDTVGDIVVMLEILLTDGRSTLRNSLSGKSQVF